MVVKELKERLEKVEKGAASFADRKTTDSLTAASLATLLTRLAVGQTQETNYPAARLLNDWDWAVSKFVKVMPVDYRRVLEEQKRQAEAQRQAEVEAGARG